MAVTTSNIIIGPCSSFQIDGVDVGGTSGGVSVEKKRDFVDIEVDQVLGTAKKGIKKDTYTVKTMLSEATLQHLQIAWGATGPVTVTASSATLNIGIDTTVTEHALVFTGPAPGGDRTFTLHRAVNIVSGASVMSKDKETLIPIEFQCLPDTTQVGNEYGTVVDH